MRVPVVVSFRLVVVWSSQIIGCVMLISCPSCRSQINGKLPKPGKYTPKCPKCGATFQMVVPDDPEMTVQVKVLPAKPKPDVTQHQEVTGDFTEGAGNAKTQEVTGAYHPPRHEPERTVEVTGAYHGQDEATEATGAYIPKNRATNTDRTAAITDASAGSNIDATTDIGGAPNAKKPAKKGTVEAQEMPDHLGGYELMKQLGAGGMGAVYLARQTSLDRSVAVKVMHANWARDPIFLARFTREAYAAAQLNHHNVVQFTTSARTRVSTSSAWSSSKASRSGMSSNATGRSSRTSPWGTSCKRHAG